MVDTSLVTNLLAVDKISGVLEKIGGNFGAFGKVAAASLIGIGGSAVAAGKLLYEVGATFDDLSDTIRVGTGATGTALDGLVDVAKNVGRNVPVEFDKIGPVVADLNTRLGLTGDTLDTVASQFLQAGRILGEDVDIQSTTAALSVFGIQGDQVSGSLDQLFRVSQATGVGMNELSATLNQSGGAVQQLGFSFSETASLIGVLDKAGVDSNAVLASMSKSLVTLAKKGEDAPAAFRRVTDELKNLIATGDDTAALDLAAQVFGTRGAAQFVAAVKTGKVNIDDMAASAGLSQDTIIGVANDTADMAESWQLFKNRALLAIEPVATRVFNAFGDGMKWFNAVGSPALASFAEIAQTKLAPALQQVSDWSSAHLVPALQAIGTYTVSTVIPALAQLWSWFQERVLPAVMDLAATVIGALSSAFDTIKAKIEENKPQLEQLWGWFVTLAGFITDYVVPAYATYLKGALEVAGVAIGGVIEVIGFLVTAGEVMASGISTAIDTVKAAFTTASTWASEKINEITGFFTGLPAAITGVGADLLKAGSEIIGKLFEGMKSAAGGVGQLARDIGTAIKNGINSLLSLPIKIPEIDTHIPGVGTVGGQTLLPAFYKGGVLPEGWATVGERGPELVRSSGGRTEVFSNSKSKSMLADANGAGGADMDSLLRELISAVNAQTVALMRATQDAADAGRLALAAGPGGPRLR